MQPEPQLKDKIERIASLIEQVESCSDPHTRALAKELLESIMALHGAGLERILEMVASCGETGNPLIHRLACDELVHGLLLLYGLHPDDLRTRVERVLEKQKGFLESYAAHAELLAMEAEGEIHVRLHLEPNGGCGSAAHSLRSTLEAALQDAAPDASAIVVEEVGARVGSFVPLAQLQNGRPPSAALVESSGRNGD